MLNYTECIEYLEYLKKSGYSAPITLERIFLILKELGDPETAYKKIHVTGTNGKGSVTSMITNILIESGIRVGKFTSPHINKYNERIQVNGEDISDEEFVEVINDVKSIVDKLTEEKRLLSVKWAEFMAAAAFLYFKIRNVEYAVIEVNKGGLYDATNLIYPVLSIITNVDLDHLGLLGNTISQIAYQKAGIIKEKVPVITAAKYDDALLQIRAAAKRKDSPLFVYGKNFYGKEIQSALSGQELFFCVREKESLRIKIKLCGEHQIVNSCLAVAAGRLLARNDSRVTNESIYKGLANTEWPGRFERISLNPDIICDGSTNCDAAKSLRNALNKYYPGKPVIYIFALLSEKNPKAITDILLYPEDIIYMERAYHSSLSISPIRLLNEIGKQAVIMPNLTSTYHSALSHAKKNNGIIVVCGSFHLIGEFKKMLNDLKANQ